MATVNTPKQVVATVQSLKADKQKKNVQKKTLKKNKMVEKQKDLNNSDISIDMKSDSSDEHEYTSKKKLGIKNNVDAKNDVIVKDNDEIIEKTLAEEAIEYANSIFKFAQKEFAYVYDKEQQMLYFKGKEIAEYLGFKNTNKCIGDHVSKDDKIKFSDLLKKMGHNKVSPLEKFKGNETLPLEKSKGSQPLPLENLKGNEKNTIYITEFGLYDLILNIRTEESLKFKDFIRKELLPSVRKTGTYTLPTQMKSYQKKKPTLFDILYNTNSIKSFYDEIQMHKYFDVCVVYLGVIGIYTDGEITGYIIKFGFSNDLGRRDLKEHQATFGKQFKIICAIQTDNGMKVESEFKKAIKMKDIDLELIFNGKLRKELCFTTSETTIKDLIKMMEEFVVEYPTKATRERDEKIKQLEYYNINALAIEQEKTKQLELQYKLKLLEFENGNKIKDKIDVGLVPVTCVYLQFLNEKTKKSKTHIHCTTLFMEYKKWFKEYKKGVILPSNKEFISCLEKYKNIEKVRVGNIVLLGIKNLELKD